MALIHCLPGLVAEGKLSQAQADEAATLFGDLQQDFRRQLEYLPAGIGYWIKNQTHHLLFRLLFQGMQVIQHHEALVLKSALDFPAYFHKCPLHIPFPSIFLSKFLFLWV